jgi:hypothetical protein
MNRVEEGNATRPDENCDRWQPTSVADSNRRALAYIIGRLSLFCSEWAAERMGGGWQEGRGFIWSIWFNQTSETDQIHKRDQTIFVFHFSLFTLET